MGQTATGSGLDNAGGTPLPISKASILVARHNLNSVKVGEYLNNILGTDINK